MLIVYRIGYRKILLLIVEIRVSNSKFLGV